jgi:cytochrome c
MILRSRLMNFTHASFTLTSSVFLGLVLIGSSGLANADEALAKKSACYACHANDSKVLGPSFKDIAKRYQGQENAAAKLAESIKAGGTGKWGTMPMPPQEQIKPADLQTLATWILSMK